MDAPALDAQISISLPVDMVDACDRIARALNHDRDWLIMRALRQYFDREGADLLQEAAGLASLDRGDDADFDAVQSEAKAIIAQVRATHAQAAG